MENKQFNATQYKRQYNKDNYARWDCRIKKDLFKKLNDYMIKNNLSRSQFLEKSIELLQKNDKK